MAKSRLFLASGDAISLGNELGAGGEGTTYRSLTDRSAAVKLYHPAKLHEKGKLYERKIQIMVANTPKDADGSGSLAWPKSAVMDKRGQFVGYAMPLVDTAKSVKWHNAANPTTRESDTSMPGWLRSFSWRYRLQACRNLAGVVQAAHSSGYILGDLNQSNIFVDGQAFVRLIDLDSIQVHDNEHSSILPCTVAANGFLAPELMRKDLDTTTRYAPSDYFVLAVHIYQMLMEGWGPYSVVWNGVDEKPTATLRIQRGLYVHSGDKRLSSPPSAPPLTFLPASLQKLFLLCFSDGATNPKARPSAGHWISALAAESRKTKNCPMETSHSFPEHLGRCPWCARSSRSSSRPAQVGPVGGHTGGHRPAPPGPGQARNRPARVPPPQLPAPPVPYVPPAANPQLPQFNAPWLRVALTRFAFAVAGIVVLGGLLGQCSSSDSIDNGSTIGPAITTSAPPTGSDLRIPNFPISNLQCDGQFVLIVKSSVGPDDYATEMSLALENFPGTSYLRTDESCTSFNQISDNGTAIYAAYYGPFQSADEALNMCSRAPDDAYMKGLSSDDFIEYCRDQ